MTKVIFLQIHREIFDCRICKDEDITATDLSSP